jgi:formylglycine-generating enzyme required for sulfatase activity
MEPSFQDLIARLDELSDRFADLRDGVRKAVLVADVDPEMALTRVRKVLEYMVRDVFERRVKEPPGTRPLENLLQRLVKEGFFPERLDAYATTVRKLGNVGTHSFAERVTAGDVYQSLTHLLPILEWYFEVERPESGVRLSAGRVADAEPGRPGPSRVQPARIAVVPKGLRSFDAADSDFFLALLPGPRDRDGLPESLRFWKYRIEETREPTFAVGVLYGPSGCGKSSLVKAGLLPRLAPRIVAIHVEATAAETEARLLAGLRKRLPGPVGALDLTQALTVLRQGQGLGAEQKVLLVIDQFEQWLHARRLERDTELAQALRQCDGEHVQCVVLVRDDFWLALSRFMGELQIEILQGRNAALVDLFDPIHARHVLAEFGRAYGRLPEDLEALSREAEGFLTKAVEGLAQDGRVISIRLALFAEMVKGKPWSAATLKEVGGTSGVGVRFLEETFGSSARRGHQRAAQATLRALLPGGGMDIRDHMRSYDDLLHASGNAARPEAFEDLLALLDRELRLITPTDPSGVAGEDRGPHADPRGKYYQLTHDYLVPSLRQWLASRQKETRRGRAELLLEDRASLWTAKPENRYLPSAWEWRSIRLWTRKKDWTEPQRRMMKKAGRLYGLQALALAVLIGLCTWWGIDTYANAHASALVESLKSAPLENVPSLVQQISFCRRWADPKLLDVLRSTPGRKQRLNVTLALLPVEPHQADELYFYLVSSASVEESAFLVETLNPYRARLLPRLWSGLESEGLGESALPVTLALAVFDPQDARWNGADSKIDRALETARASVIDSWFSSLNRGWIHSEYQLNKSELKILSSAYKLNNHELSKFGRIRNLAYSTATGVRVAVLMDLMLSHLLMKDVEDALNEGSRLEDLVSLAGPRRAAILPRLQAVLARRVTAADWNDAAIPPHLAPPDAALAQRIESAQGLLTPRFAFCQTMPLAEFLATAEGLRKSGYRPVRFRPYAVGRAVQVAAVFTRDPPDWKIEAGLTREELFGRDEANRTQNYNRYYPTDVAGYVARDEGGNAADRFAAIWMRQNGSYDARLYAGESEESWLGTQNRLRDAKLAPRTLHLFSGTSGHLSYSGVWDRSSLVRQSNRDQLESELSRSLTESSEMILADLSVASAGRLRPLVERARSSLESALKKLKASPGDVQARLTRAWADLVLDDPERVLDDLRDFAGAPPQAETAAQYRILALARLGRKEEALDALATLGRGTAPERTRLYLAAVTAAELGVDADLDAAFEALEGRLRSRPDDGPLHYDAACAYSLASRAVATSDPARASRYARRSLELLKAAIRAGYTNFRHMLLDADLEPVRDAPEFAKVTEPAHYDRRYAAVWSGEPGFEVAAVHGLDPAAHLEQARELIAGGHRPDAWSVTSIETGGSLVSASVWRRPVVTEEQRDRLAVPQSRAAVAMAQMGERAALWPLLQHSTDPRLRSALVDRLGSGLWDLREDPRVRTRQGGSVVEIRQVPMTRWGMSGLELCADRFETMEGIPPSAADAERAKMDAVLFAPATSARRALLLALGSYAPETDLTDSFEEALYIVTRDYNKSEGRKLEEDRDRLIAVHKRLVDGLLDRYRNDPDAGIHGAVGWTLRRWKQEARLGAIDRELGAVGPGDARRWYVNGQGQTFAEVAGPVEFVMGSPTAESGRVAGQETCHRVVIPRRFAIAAGEVTVEQFRRFLAHHPHFRLGEGLLKRFSPDPRGPCVAVDWYGAAAYCNWLSEQEGLSRDQWCYLPNRDGEYAEGMTIPADVLERTGYRLPTEAEWEYACRAGSQTSRPYGNSLDLLGSYAWCQKGDPDPRRPNAARSAPVSTSPYSQTRAVEPTHARVGGSLLPNDLGLFDMLGNVSEWCQDRWVAQPTGGEGPHNDVVAKSEVVTDKVPRVVRGGSFNDPPAGVRSASRVSSTPSYGDITNGFRPARTLPD